MNKGFITAIAASLSMLLTGCSLNQPTPEMSYHLLDKQKYNTNTPLPNERVALDKVILSDFLLQPNLVMRVAGNKLDIASYHSWAEPLDKSIRRVLINKLNHSQQKVGVVNRCKGCGKLTLYVDHFYPEQEGKVVLSGHLIYVNEQGEETIEYYHLEGQQQGAGYSASVEVMHSLLLQLADRVAAVIN